MAVGDENCCPSGSSGCAGQDEWMLQATFHKLALDQGIRFCHNKKNEQFYQTFMGGSIRDVGHDATASSLCRLHTQIGRTAN